MCLQLHRRFSYRSHTQLILAVLCMRAFFLPQFLIQFYSLDVSLANYSRFTLPNVERLPTAKTKLRQCVALAFAI